MIRLPQLLLSLLFCLGSFATVWSQYTDNITNPSDGYNTFGGLHVASRSANLALQAGQNAVMNVTVMAQIDNQQQVLFNVPAGRTLIVQGLSGNSGFQYSGILNESSAFAGIRVQGGGKVVFSNLQFEGFVSDIPLSMRSAVELDDMSEVRFEACTFLNNDIGIQLDNCFSGSIKNNVFSHDNQQLAWYASTFSGNVGRGVGVWVNHGPNSGPVDILKNTFYSGASIAGPTGTQLASTAVEVRNDVTNNGHLRIRLNQIHFLDFGVRISNQSSHTGSLFNVQTNTFQSLKRGVAFYNALPHWQLNNNQFSLTDIDLYLEYNQAISGTGFRIMDDQNFSNPMYTAFNIGNQFSTTSTFPMSIRVNNTVAPGSWTILSGLDINGYVDVVNGPATLIRSSIIRHSTPIIHNSNGNNNIPAPLVSKALLNGGQINIDYTLPGLVSGHEEYVVDVYRTNSMGHLLDYLGSAIINPLGIPGQGYQMQVVAPVGLALAAGDQLAVTTTSSAVGSNLALGTSEVVYFSIDDPRSDCDCISQFSPLQGKEYVLSAWVKVDQGRTLESYAAEASISLEFAGAPGSTPSFSPSGPIIEGWQKIEAPFTVPGTATNIRVKLNNLSLANRDVFFDDIRIFPFEGNMKSFVYDPSTFRLVAELDENNHATYYVYDDEGQLVQMKKETTRGIQTLSEGRSSRYLQP